MGNAILELKNIVKTFPGVLALNGIDFQLNSGEIHAICGENGAGKSTLMKVVCGVHKPDTLNTGVLWNCMDLGYLSVQTGYQLVSGEVTPESESINAGRLGEKAIEDKVCVLGDALVFGVDTVDNYDY